MNTTTLTPDVFDEFTRDDRWLGFGYLGGRRNTLASTDPVSPHLVEAVDRRVVDWANYYGWTRDELFAWANSKAGRWFADVMFGSHVRVDTDFEQAVRWNLLAKQPEE